ncbi:response regulator transcription factor [Aurantimonas sp. 22II-16-19i]|uniref:response regulator transcription factor n=1 Tax=Aurantimonas sp. 22II-16-19i TaxID=1317114 RepID=UPI001FDA4321|nr:response regulator transcription factor [Aurantimonas sp. 22II-16-19i]
MTVIIANDYSQRKRTEAENCGVNGILLTSISSDRLLKSLELIAMGEDVFTATGHSHISATSEQNDLGDVPAFTRLLPGVHREEPPTDAEDGPAVDQQASNNAVQSQKDCKLIRREELSQRESEILNYLIEGNSNKIIARKCHITEATVKVHLKSILRKVHAANRTQAAVWAMNRIKESEQARAVESGIARENDEDGYSNDRCGISSRADKRFVPPRPILGTRVEEFNCP